MEAEPRVPLGKTQQQGKAAGSKRLLCPAAMPWLSAAGRKVQKQARQQQATPQQIRGSATHQVTES